MSGRVARTVEDVILGEAVHGTVAERLADMTAIASVISNRAMQTGVSPLDVVSTQREFNAYGKTLPAGVEHFRDLARMALVEVETYGPATNATFFATPATVHNLPEDLQQAMATTGHVYFSDPRARPIGTAVGYRAPVNAVQASTRANRSPAASPLGYAPANQNSAARAMLDNMVSDPRAATRSLSAPSQPSTTWDGSFSNPVGAITGRVTSDFGPRNPLGVGSANHLGVDLSAAPNTSGYPAEAAAPGVVTSAGPARGFGNLVEVTHPNGMVSRYGHLQAINVQVGQEIARGTPVGLVGSLGTSSGPHLHFEVRDQLGRPVNPESVADLSVRPSPTPSARPMSPAETRAIGNNYVEMARTMEDAGVYGLDGRTRTPVSIDSARFGQFAGPDPARFGDIGYDASPSAPYSPEGGYATAANTAAPKGDRLGFTRTADAARFAPETGLGRVTGQVSPVAYARAEAPTGMPSADRFAMTPEPSVDRFAAPAPASMARVSAPMSPVTGYAQATGLVNSPMRPDNASFAGPKGTFNVAPKAAPAISSLPATIDQGQAGRWLSAPVTATKTASVNPTAVARNALKTTFKAAPANPLGIPSGFVPGALPDMSLVTSYASVAQPPTTVAPFTPAPALPAPRTVRQVPVYTMQQGNFPARPAAPNLSVGSVYDGQQGTAVASDGSRVSRPNGFGLTTVSNRFGATTGMVGNRQVATGPGFGIGGFGGFGLAPGLGKTIGGSFLGAALGSAVAGPVGGLVGGIVGRNLAQGQPALGGNVGGLGGLGGFLGGLFGGGNSTSGGKSSGGKSSASGSKSSGKSAGSSGFGGNRAGSARAL